MFFKRKRKTEKLIVEGFKVTAERLNIDELELLAIVKSLEPVGKARAKNEFANARIRKFDVFASDDSPLIMQIELEFENGGFLGIRHRLQKEYAVEIRDKIDNIMRSYD